MAQPWVLMIVTSHDMLGTTGARTGTWLEELATPYFTFIDAGYEVSIASPRGGYAPIDPASCESPWISANGVRFLSDAEARSKLDNSLPLDPAVGAVGFPDAAFIVGGTGTLWDFPDSQPLGRLLWKMAAFERPVAAICHGVAALLAARDNQGRSIANGRRVTCFSNAEERQLEFHAIVPFLVETALTEAGADVSVAPPFEPHVVVDGLLLTGQNPASAAPLARALVNQLVVSLETI